MAYPRSRTHQHAVHWLALASAALPLAAQAQTPTTLPEMTINASSDSGYKVDAVSSPKATQPLLNTPQTVSVISKELFKEQGASSLMEALRNTPGITLQLGENGATSAGDTFQLRGFSTQSSMFIDGVRDLGAVTRDTFNIEQVEVVKGPAGADIGRGASAGYINLVSKLPSRTDAISAEASINTAGASRLTGDLNKAFGTSSAVRLNVMAQGGDVQNRDRVENTSLGFAPSLAFGLGTPTRLYLYSQHIRQDNVPDGGIPTIGMAGFYNANASLQGGAKVNEKNYYGSASDQEKVHADMVTVKIEHDMAEGMKLSNIARYGKTSMDRIMTGVYTLAAPSANPASWTVSRLRQRVDQDNEILANQTNLSASFATGPLKHSLAAGLEFLYEKQNTRSFSATGKTVTAANLYNPNPNDALPDPYPTGAYVRGSTLTAGAYLFDTVEITPQWQVSGGVRFDRYRTETDSATATQNSTTGAVTALTPSSLSKSDLLTSWKLGALYKPATNGSVYLAYGTSQTPPGGANFSLSSSANSTSNPNMDTQDTRNMELGTKWDVLSGKLGLTAALYRTEHKNELAVLDSLSNTYAQMGKRTVEGIELGAVGQLTQDWQISAGLATMKTKVKAGSTGNNAAGAAARWSPELTATLWSSYHLNDALTLGGGVRYVSKQKRVVDPAANLAVSNMPNIPSYWVADAMVDYKVSKHVSLRLNVYNLFDEDYISTLNNSGARATLGTPRSAMLSANVQF